MTVKRQEEAMQDLLDKLNESRPIKIITLDEYGPISRSEEETKEILKEVKAMFEQKQYNEIMEAKMEKKQFLGNDISEHGLERGYVDYACLASSFDAVLCNDITKFAEDFELVNGTDYNEEDDYYYDIYQYFIIDNNGYNILKEYTDEIVYYLEDLDIYIWGVTHYGTSWRYVLTDIKIDW
jgi:hypothetical protein